MELDKKTILQVGGTVLSGVIMAMWIILGAIHDNFNETENNSKAILELGVRMDDTIASIVGLDHSVKISRLGGQISDMNRERRQLVRDAARFPDDIIIATQISEIDRDTKFAREILDCLVLNLSDCLLIPRPE